MRAIRVHQHGGPEALTVEEISVPQPGAGQLLVKLEAAGVNFIDIYHRAGIYKLRLPMVLGQEGAGIVETVGPEVTGFAPGQRVAWTNVGGSYAEYVVVPAASAVPVPDGVDPRIAASMMLQGL